MGQLRFERALIRNLHEVQRAILNRITLTSMERVQFSSLYSKLVYWGLFNDYLAHCIKVLDCRKQNASFWYLYRTNQNAFNGSAENLVIPISDLETVTDKLLHIRDKTHFHIDEKGVFDPKKIWREADLKGSELSNAVDNLWALMTDVYAKTTSKNFPMPDYDGEAAYVPTKFAEEKYSDASRIRLDCVSGANHNLNRLLDKPVGYDPVSL